MDTGEPRRVSTRGPKSPPSGTTCAIAGWGAFFEGMGSTGEPPLRVGRMGTGVMEFG